MQKFFHTLIKNIEGATIVELMVVMTIMGMGVGGLLQTIGSGIYFSKDTENNIKAINIAREGIEGVMNIRDTNWIRFSSDKFNCWNTKDYSGLCIGDTTYSHSFMSGSYTLVSKNGAWYLSGISAPPLYTNWTPYKNTFQVGIDDSGFWTQTGVVTTRNCDSQTQTGCLTGFSREITLSMIGTGTMNVSSIVRWQGKRPQSVILNTILTNWKSNF